MCSRLQLESISKREELRKAELKMGLRSDKVAREHIEIVNERLQALFDEARMYKVMQRTSKKTTEREKYVRKEHVAKREIQRMTRQRDSLELLVKDFQFL